MKNIPSSKILRVVAYAVAGVATLLIFPAVFGETRVIADNCPNPPATATLNPFPVTYTGEPCRDYPIISARLINGDYPRNAQEHNEGLAVSSGQEFYVSIYVHNGAALNLDPDQTTARNVQISTSVDSSIGAEHQVSARARGTNTNEIGGSFRIRTGPNDQLAAVPNSGELFDADGRIVDSGFNPASYRVGDMLACFPYAVYVRFKVRVESAAQPVAPSGNIFQDGNLARIPNACLFNGRVTWNTWNTSNAEVLVRDPDTGEEKVFGRSTNGTGETPWLQPTKSYRFTLWDVSSNQRSRLDEFWLETPYLDCAVATSTPTPIPTVSPSPVCQFTWSDPVTFDGRGLRRTGQASNVTMDIRGFAPWTKFYIRNTNLDDGRTVYAPMLADANGRFFAQDSTIIRANEYTVGSYKTELVLSYGDSILGVCKSFVIQSVAYNTPTPISPTPPYSPTPSPTPIPSPTPTPSYTPTPSVTPIPSSTPTPTPTSSSMTVSKLVRNITQGGGEFDSISARPNDLIEFAITFRTHGNTSINETRIFDALPAGLRYLNGTTTSDGFNVGDGITTSGGLPLGNIGAGRTMVFRFRAEVRSEEQFGFGTTTVENKVTVSSSNAGAVEDRAFVNIFRVQTVFDNFALSAQKLGKNITRGETADQGSVTAQPQDTLEFILRLRSVSTTRVNNVIIQDVLPSGLNYISRTTAVNGIIVADGISDSGINIGSLDPGQEKIVKLNTRVSEAGSFGLGTTFLTNTVRVRADNVPTLSATMSVGVFRGQVSGVTAVGGVQTGGETWVIAAAISAVMAGVLAVFTKKKGLAGLMLAQQADSNRFNFSK